MTPPPLVVHDVQTQKVDTTKLTCQTEPAQPVDDPKMPSLTEGQIVGWMGAAIVAGRDCRAKLGAVKIELGE